MAGIGHEEVGTTAKQAQCCGTGWHGDTAAPDASAQPRHSMAQAQQAPWAGSAQGAVAQPVPAVQEPRTNIVALARARVPECPPPAPPCPLPARPAL